MEDHDIITLENAELRYETESGMLISIDGNEPQWVPRKLCEFDRHEHELQIPEWLAIEKEFI